MLNGMPKFCLGNINFFFNHVNPFCRFQDELNACVDDISNKAVRRKTLNIIYEILNYPGILFELVGIVYELSNRCTSCTFSG